MPKSETLLFALGNSFTSSDLHEMATLLGQLPDLYPTHPAASPLRRLAHLLRCTRPGESLFVTRKDPRAYDA